MPDIHEHEHEDEHEEAKKKLSEILAKEDELFIGGTTIFQEILKLKAENQLSFLRWYFKTCHLVSLMEDSKEVKDGANSKQLTALKKWLDDYQKPLAKLDDVKEFVKSEMQFPPKIDWQGNLALFCNQYDMALIIRAICDFSLERNLTHVNLKITLPQCPSDKEGDKKDHLEKYLTMAFNTAAKSGYGQDEQITIEIDGKKYTQEFLKGITEKNEKTADETLRQKFGP